MHPLGYDPESYSRNMISVFVYFRKRIIHNVCIHKFFFTCNYCLLFSVSIIVLKLKKLWSEKKGFIVFQNLLLSVGFLIIRLLMHYLFVLFITLNLLCFYRYSNYYRKYPSIKLLFKAYNILWQLLPLGFFSWTNDD